MKLVFFWDAIEHISRICRVLRQPRGNAMLVGVGGSGKQSLTRFASYISEMKCFQIELSKGYGYTEFREDLKKLYMMAGCDGTPVVFLFSDTQARHYPVITPQPRCDHAATTPQPRRFTPSPPRRADRD